MPQEKPYYRLIIIIIDPLSRARVVEREGDEETIEEDEDKDQSTEEQIFVSI
jgi:hypothetical protein